MAGPFGTALIAREQLQRQTLGRRKGRTDLDRNTAGTSAAALAQHVLGGSGDRFRAVSRKFRCMGLRVSEAFRSPLGARPVHCAGSCRPHAVGNCIRCGHDVHFAAAGPAKCEVLSCGPNDLADAGGSHRTARIDFRRALSADCSVQAIGKTHLGDRHGFRPSPSPPHCHPRTRRSNSRSDHHVGTGAVRSQPVVHCLFHAGFPNAIRYDYGCQGADRRHLPFFLRSCKATPEGSLPHVR